MSNPGPGYQHSDGIHTATWPDGTRLVMDHPHQEKQHYYAFVRAYTASGALACEAPLRIFDTNEAVRFALRTSAVNGANHVDWNPRLIYLATNVRATLMAQAAATPPIPLRRDQRPAERYPIEALGSLLAPMAQVLMTCIQAPDAICCQSVLAAATLAVQPFANVVIDGRDFPLSQYFLDIGESGERRSAVDRTALYPHRQYERQLFEAYGKDKVVYTNNLDAWKRARDTILKKRVDLVERQRLLAAMPQSPTAPLDPIVITEEPTYEGLVKLFVRGHPSLGLYSDEGGRFLGGHSMNAENETKTATGLCELWDGKRVTRVRASEDTAILYSRRLAMHLMIQPIIAHKVLHNATLTEQGFLNRCLMCWPTSTAGERMYKPYDLTQDTHVQAYNARILACLKTMPPLAPGTRNELDPRPLRLAHDAHGLWVKFHDHIEGQLKAGAPLAPIRGFGNKVAELTARLAGILTLIAHLDAATIASAQMEAAITLMEFYIQERLRLFGVGEPDPDIALAETLLGTLKGKGRTSLPDIYQRGPDGVRDAKTARRIVKILEEHGWLQPIPGGSDVGGIHRREAWEVRA
jgi:hypothetical protein